MITAFLHKTETQTGDDYFIKESWSVNLKNLADFLDVDEIAPRVRSVFAGSSYASLPDAKQKAIRLFIEAVNEKGAYNE